MPALINCIIKGQSSERFAKEKKTNNLITILKIYYINIISVGDIRIPNFKHILRCKLNK